VSGVAALPELLAPAADLAIALAAFDHGADAVYVGLERFNLRAQAPSLSLDGLGELLGAAAERKRRVYVVLNTMPDDRTLAAMASLVDALAFRPRQPDAVIVSDAGVLTVVKQRLPGVALHLSTQTGVFNSAAIRFWAGQGVARVILPRELTIEEVTALSANGACETEVFIHGAMCVSISGRCLLGAYLSGRHPNRGECPQPCRLSYSITPHEPRGEKMNATLDAEEDERGVYLLNSRDLNTLSILPAIVASGVRALKIEGRTKSLHYVSAVTRVYREALDAFWSAPASFAVRAEWTAELERVEHRPYTTGFYAGEYLLQAVHASKAQSGYRLVGVVKALMDGGGAVVDVKNPFGLSDTLSVLPVDQGVRSCDAIFEDMSDINGRPVGRAASGRLVVLRGKVALRPGDLLRRSTAASQLNPQGGGA
jgi:U32 family peptidase